MVLSILGGNVLSGSRHSGNDNEFHICLPLDAITFPRINDKFSRIKQELCIYPCLMLGLKKTLSDIYYFFIEYFLMLCHVYTNIFLNRLWNMSFN